MSGSQGCSMRCAGACVHDIRTEKAYVSWGRCFILLHEMGEAEVNARRRVAASTRNPALFLHDNVLERPLGHLGRIVRARRPKRLPVVLTRQDVALVLSFCSGVPFFLAQFLYGGGCRLLRRCAFVSRTPGLRARRDQRPRG